MLLVLLNHNADSDPVSKDVQVSNRPCWSLWCSIRSMFMLIQDQCTPLHIAAKKGNVSCVKALVDANCCLNKRNKVCMYFLTLLEHYLLEEVIYLLVIQYCEALILEI